MKRQIALLLILVFAMGSSRAQEWRQLFNGKDLTGWEQVGPGHFVVEDGLLKTVSGMGMILYPAQKFENVVIRVVFKVKDNDCNSGVFIRLPEKPKDEWDAVNHGYEVQIDNGTRHVGGDFHCTGVLYSLTKALAHPQKAPGEWNVYEIRLNGPNLRVSVNGKLVNEASGCEVVAGSIGLQSEGGRIQFRKVELTPLD